MIERRAYSIREFCEATGVGRTTLYEAIKRGEIKPLRLGRRVLIPAHHLAHHLELADHEQMRTMPNKQKRKRPEKSERNKHFPNNDKRPQT